MLRLAEALRISSLSDNARVSITFSVGLYNFARHTHAQQTGRVGRPLDLSTHILVDGLLDILESEVGIDVRISKRRKAASSGGDIHANGVIADFLRVIWDALERPGRNADAFARLAADCASCLGGTMDERKKRRARRRAPRLKYEKELRWAWRR